MPVPTENITKERLERWSKRLAADHGTPLLLVGVGHDHNKGRLIVCTLEEPGLSVPTLCAILRGAARDLEGCGGAVHISLL